MMVQCIGGPDAGKTIEIRDESRFFDRSNKPVRSVYQIVTGDSIAVDETFPITTYHIHKVSIGNVMIYFATPEPEDFLKRFTEMWTGYSRFMENPHD